MNGMISKISVVNYRGFREIQTIELSDFNHITFLVGANNSGKSLIARVFSVFHSNLSEDQNNLFVINNVDDRDFYEFNTEKDIVIELLLDKNYLNEDIAKSFRSDCEEIIFKIVIKKRMNNYLCYLIINDGMGDSHDLVKENYEENTSFRDRNFFSQINTSCKRLFNDLRNKILAFSSVRSFDINTEGDSETMNRDWENNRLLDVNGATLIHWLKQNKHHGEARRAKDQVSKWLKELNMEVPRAVRVDESGRMLVFTFENHLELSSKEVGTGYTMLYILLMEIARNQKQLIIIDEIESHLQPGLIRILIKILRQYGKAQYMIATHSPTVLETSNDNDRIYKFKKEANACKITGFTRGFSEESEGIKFIRDVCNELGVIPGDALMSNSVIWVEGPSEVLWLRKWLKVYYQMLLDERIVSQRLIEGLHYSILMTGGNLIAHLSFSEDEMDIDEIKNDYALHVLRINPNPFVMTDSDGIFSSDSKEGKKVRILRIAKELKQINEQNVYLSDDAVDEDQIESEIGKIPNLWILKGKEIENYAHPELLKSFYANLEGKKNSTVKDTAKCTNWDVYSETEGVGEILERRGVTGVKAKSGTIKHKAHLAQYIFDNLSAEHFTETKDKFENPPNESMVKEIVRNLRKLIRYIYKVNGIEVPEGFEIL